MRSTGEVRGIDDSFAIAFAKAEHASRLVLPRKGNIFMSFADKYKPAVLPPDMDLADMGYKILATRGTYASLIAGGLNPGELEMILREREGKPSILDKIRNGEVQLYMSTPSQRLSDIEAGRVVR